MLLLFLLLHSVLFHLSLLISRSCLLTCCPPRSLIPTFPTYPLHIQYLIHYYDRVSTTPKMLPPTPPTSDPRPPCLLSLMLSTWAPSLPLPPAPNYFSIGTLALRFLHTLVTLVCSRCFPLLLLVTHSIDHATQL